MEVSTRPPLVDGKLGLPLHSSSSAEPEDDFTLSVDESDIFPDEERESPKSPVNDSRLRFKHSVINGSTSTTREIEVKRAGCELDSDSALCNGEVVRESVPDSATVFRTENASEVEETEVLLNPGESHGRTEGSSCTVSFNSDAENSSSRNANAAADENDKSPTQKRDDESPRQILNSQSIAECEEVLGARQKEEEVINTGNCEAADRNEGFHATQLNNGANCSNDIMGKITNTKSIRDGKERSGVQDSISNTAPSDDGLDEYESGSIQVIDISSLPHALRAMNTDDHLMLDESSSLADDHDGIVQTGGDEEVVEANDCARSVETEDGEAKILKVKGAIEVAQHLVEDGVNKGTAQGNEPMAEEIDEDEEQLPSVVGVESLAPASSLKTAESSVDAGGVETFTVAGDSGLAKELADAVGSCDEPVDGGGIKPADGGDETLAAVSDATVSDAVESDKVLASNEDAIGEPMLSANCKDVESVESAEGRGDEPVSDTTEALDDEGSVAADQGSVADHHMEADQDINAAASEDDNGEPVVSTHQKDVESGETTDGGEPAADTTEAPEDEGSVGADDGSTADYDTEVDQGDEQGSPDYQGMPDDILPIIESELDDIPVGGEGLFDTEVEGVDDTQDGDNSSTSPHQNDLAGDGEVSLMVSEDSRLVEDDGTTKKKKLLEKFSSNHRQKLKRRASEDLTQYSPPLKILKRQSSLDHMDDIAGRDTTKTLQEFKTLLLNEPPKAPAGIVTEPLDIPIEFDLFKKGASKPAKDAGEEKRKHATSIGDGQSSTVTERLLETEDQSVLVIDLDDDDDKQDIVQPKVEKTSKLEEALRQPPPRNAMDALFKGKEEITLNRKTFSKLVKSFASQYLFTVGDFGKVARLSLQADDVLTKMQASSSSFDKQKDDFKAIMTKLIDDRKEKKTWDESLAPPKVTRSVGLQVCSVGSMYVSNSMEAEGTGILNRYATPNTPVTSTNQNQALAQQKLAYAQQQLAMAQQNKVKHPVDIRPTAKKSITAPKRPLTNRSLQPTPISAIKSGKVNGQQVQITNKLNGFSKALTVSRNPPERPQPVTVTTVSPNSKTFTLTSNRTYAKVITSTSHKSNNLTLARPVSQPIQPRVTKTIAIPAKPVSTLGTMTGSNVVPVAVSHTLNSPLQGSRNLASGPGRPMIKPPPPKAQNTINISPAISTSPADRGMQNSTPADKRKITSDSSLIDLTEMDDEVPQPTKSAKTSSTAKKSTTPRMGIPAKILSGSIPIGPKPLRHPALPPNPPHFNVLTAPPKPYLGICDTQKVTQGIMLTWHFQNVIPQRKISKFQVFAYQESKSEGDDSWKKVGDVDSLPLPMACTLTQFREGYTYHFIVRAVDETGNIGPFSAPNTITLMKKVS